MKELAYEQVQIREDLSYRIVKNYARLEGREYRPETIFSMDGSGWPGDWEGRTLLAWALLSRTTGRRPAFWQGVKACLDEAMNERHYFKEILHPGQVNEQQLSGHNWLLRAFLEEYLRNSDEEMADRARQLVENLYLPIRGKYKEYPISGGDRSIHGEASGTIAGKAINGWYLSTDVGCAYMSLDGLSQYYQIFGDKRVGELIEEMIESFRAIDFVKEHMQTHASLSAVRGIMRYYQCCGKKELLDFAEDFFALYRCKAMTENYANYNWFGRPEWTEPCAIVDSYLLSMELFKATERGEYAQCANRIYYNALGHAQRENGGFGCDRCAGGGREPDILAIHPANYEAFWCCSMRGAEGLTRAARSAVLADRSRYAFVNYLPMRYAGEAISFTLSTQYPYEGWVEIVVEELKNQVVLEFYLPEGTSRENISLSLDGRQQEWSSRGSFIQMKLSSTGVIQLHFPIELRIGGTVNEALSEDYATLWHGDLLLGHPLKMEEEDRMPLPKESRQKHKLRIPMETADGEMPLWEKPEYLGKGHYRVGEYIVEPVNTSIYRDKEEMLAHKYQILY